MSGFPYDKPDMLKGLGGGGLSKPTPNPANLAASLVAVMSEVGPLAKDGHNAFSGYDFTTETMVVNTLRPLLVKHGLAFIPHNVSTYSEQQINEKMRRVAITATFLLLHTSGENITITVPGEGMDSLDKSTAKAMTMALKYALLQTFLCGRGEDGDEGKGYEQPKRSENAAVRAATAEVPQVSRAHARNEDYVLTFGKHKDESIHNVPNEYLKWLAGKTEDDLKDKEKAKWAGRNKELLDHILTEFNRRAAIYKAPPTEYDGSPSDGNIGDIPF